MTAISRLLDWVDSIFAAIPHWFIALLARVVLGLVFYMSFLTKFDFATWSLKPTVFFLFENEYKLPLIPPVLAAYLATALESIGSVMLIAGLLTRPVALAFLLMTLVIQIFVYPHAYLVHGIWAVGLLYLMKYGPGQLSLDWLFGRRT